jgi:hypothetical protein
MQVGAQVAAEAFRIISEGLSNVLRHTAARRAFVRLHSRDGWLQLAIGNESANAGGAPRSFIPGRSANAPVHWAEQVSWKIAKTGILSST